MASSTFEMFVAGTTDVATADLQLQIDSTSRVVRSVTLIAHEDNVSNIHYGGSDVETTTQKGIPPGASIVIARTPDARGRDMVWNSNSLYINSATANDGVDFIIELDEA